jgi:hypothetical protein
LFLIFSLCKINAQQVKHYITSSAGQPWGSNANIVAMNQTFGAGIWVQSYFETVNVNALFTSTVCFIFMDGSANNAVALNNFLSANSLALQAWVANGGNLFLDAAPVVGGNINFLFGTNLLNYNTGPYSSVANAANGMSTHTIFAGPYTPAGTAYTGNFASHGFLTGTGVPVMNGTTGTLLSEQFYGNGHIFFGSLVVPTYMNPTPNVGNLRANTLSMLGCCGITQSITATATPSSVCIGQSATITASGGSGGVYSIWPGGIISNSVVITPTTNGNYNVIFTPTSGCMSGVTIPLSVFGGSLMSMTGNTAICVGSGFTLTAGGGNTYSWSTGATTASITGSPSVTTVYTVVGTNTAGCTATLTPTINVSPMPTVSITGPTLICSGQSANLIGNGATNYTWSNGQVAPSTFVTPTANVVYTVVGTNNGACTATAAISISVNPGPTLAVVGASAICVGTTVTLTASGANSYSWNTGAVTNTVAVSPTVTTTYSVVGTMSLGACSQTLFPTINVSPVPTVAISGTNQICAGSSVTLSASGANSFTWNTGATSASIVVSPYNTTLYAVTGTNNGACTGTAALTVSVNPSPTITLSGATPTLCSPQTMTLVAAGGTTYLWNTGSTNNSIVVTPTVSTTYSVTGFGANGCYQVKTVSISFGTPPTVVTNAFPSNICAGQTATLFASGAYTYTWSTGATGFSLVVSPTVTTIYVVTGTSFQGCVGPIGVITVTVDVCTGENEWMTFEKGINLFPDPTKGEFFVEANEPLSKIEILDLSGKIILEEKVKEKKIHVNMMEFNSGIYFVRICSDKNSVVRKIVKE